MTWTIVESGAAPAADNMRLDRDFLLNLHEYKHPILHLYDWKENAATYGYFIKPEKFIDLDKIKEIGFDIARRPTGGGIIFHTCDFAFSILVPSSHPKYSINPLENYAFINGLVLLAIRKFLGHNALPQLLIQERGNGSTLSRQFCMAKPTKFDIMLEGKKVGGAAQRRMKQGLLHQGSIAISVVEEKLARAVLLNSDEVFPLMQSHTFPLLGKKLLKKSEISQARAQIRKLLKDTVLNS
jgi:lipoate---protein ligase